MMFALGIRYLNGWAMATHPTNRERAEWPPHPDRVFMALVAAHFETDGDEDERRALEWLQLLPAPAMAAKGAYYREIVTSYVPVNDTEINRPMNDSPTALAKRMGAFGTISTMKESRGKGLALLPEHRSRQPRPFPVAIPQPEDNTAGIDQSMPRVYLRWESIEASTNHQRALASLCAKVVSIGHSASLVQMWVELSPPAANLIPVEGAGAKHRLRVTTGNRLNHLESRYKAGLRPAFSLWQGYADVKLETSVFRRSHSCFDSNLLVLRRVAGPRLGLESTLQVTQALRNTIMKNYPLQPPPTWISGHAADGSPSQHPHLAFAPLPHVGHAHADGHLLGVAIVVPRNVTQEEQEGLGRVLLDDYGQPQKLNLLMGRIGVWAIELCQDDELREALQPNTWTDEQAVGWENSTASRWATVTPIVFDRHPKSPGEGEGTVAASCERIGLPRPTKVVLTSSPKFAGVPHARRYENITHKHNSVYKKSCKRFHAHAVLTFDQPIIGPVLLGAGRYRGYGLCRPLRDGGVM